MRQTTIYQIPYAEPTDAPRAYPTDVDKPAKERIETLLKAVDDRTEDTGWQTCPTGSLFNAGVFIRRIGKAVYLRGKFELKTGANLSNITYGGALYLPEGFHPTYDVHIAITARNPSVDNGGIRPQATLEILPAGRANLHIHATGLDMALPGMCSYLID